MGFQVHPVQIGCEPAGCRSRDNLRQCVWMMGLQERFERGIAIGRRFDDERSFAVCFNTPLPAVGGCHRLAHLYASGEPLIDQPLCQVMGGFRIG